MKKIFIYLVIFTTIFVQPGLMMAEEISTSASTSVESSKESIILQSPETAAVVDPLATLSDAEQAIKDTEIAKPTDPTPVEIIDPNVSVGDNLVPDPINPIDNNINNEAVNLNNDPQRDPAEGNEQAFSQEKSADNSAKKTAGLTGSLRVDQFSGAASYNLPLDIPAGRNGLNPVLNLFYNSHDRSVDSWVGHGWGMDFGYISRSSKTGTNNLYTSGQLTLNFGGNAREIILVDEQNHLYASKEESDYLKIQYLPDSLSWLVLDTSGNKYYFGQAAASRQDDPTDQNKIFKWQLDRVEDANGNFYRFEYTKRNGAIYPARIVYTGNGQTDGIMEVVFNLEDRNDDSVSYASQFAVITDKRLNNIEIKVSGTTVTKYQLAYTTGQNRTTSLLSSITKKGYLNGQEYSLPTTNFTYQNRQSLEWQEDNQYWQNVSVFNRRTMDDSSDYTSPTVFDINGDAWADVGGAFGNQYTFSGGEWNFPECGQGCNILAESIFGDFNGDKFLDLLTTVGSIRLADGQEGIRWQPKIYLSNKINGYSFSQTLSDSLPYFSGERFLEPLELSDVNGDGLDDIIFARKHEDHNHQRTVQRHVYLNTGSGWQEGYGDFPGILARCNSNQYIYCNKVSTYLIDINNDGLPDVYSPISVNEQNINYSAGIYLNTGSGWQQEPSQVWVIPEALRENENISGFYTHGGIRFTDLNNDGLVDILVGGTIYNYQTGANPETILTYLNNGFGWTENANWRLPSVFMQDRHFDWPQIWWADMGVRLFDINNDGLMDMVRVAHDYDRNDQIIRTTRLAQGNVPNLLSVISNGYGAETEITYQASARFFNEDESFKNPKLPLNLQVVKSITTSDGEGNDLITNYDYADGFYSIDVLDHTKNQFTGFGEVVATTGDQVVKTYYHQGGGIDGYELGEYDDSIGKKGRVYREEAFIKNEDNTLTSLSAKVSTWKEQLLDNTRKIVYLDGTVAYDYTQSGEQQQRAPGRDGLEAQAVNQQALAESYSAQVLPTQALSQLQQAQTFIPVVAPQLVYESEDGWQKIYYLGRQNNGQNVFRYEIYSGQANNNEQPQRDDNEEGNVNIDPVNSGDGYIYYSRNRFPFQQETWQEVRDAANGTNVDNRSAGAELFEGIIGIRNPYSLSRVFLPFDTSVLPDDITITGVSLGLSAGIPDNANPTDFYVVHSSQETPNLNVSDYSRVENDSGALVEAWRVDNRRANINLSENVFEWIDTSGYTKLALRTDNDFNNQQPRINSMVSIAMSEANQEERPKLTIDFYYNNINPGIPTDLQVENQTNPDNITAQQPDFSAVYNDENAEDQAVAYQIQIIRASLPFLREEENEHSLFDSPLCDINGNLDQSVAVGEQMPDIQYNCQALPLDGRQYFWRIRFRDSGQDHNIGLWSSGEDYFYMDGSIPPIRPVNPLTESRINPQGVLNQNPSFSAIYVDPNPIDLAKWYQIQVDDNQDFSSPVWNSDKQLFNIVIDNGVRSEEIRYGGEALEYNGITYYWRIKFWDDEAENGTEGVWSAPANFSMFNSEDVLNNVQAKAAKYHYDFSDGNVLQEENLGTVLTASNGIFLNTNEAVLGDEKNSTYEYAEPINEAVRILSAPIQKVIANPNNEEETATVTINYDGRNDNLVEKANPTKEDLNLQQTIYEKTFNTFGLATQTKDPLNHLTNVVYDAVNYYPTRTTNHLNQITQTEYDLKTGQIKRTVDPNGVVEERGYDAFGRLLEIRKINPNSVNLLVMQRYEYHDNENPSWVKQTDFPGDSLEKSTYNYFDGLGRKIQTRQQTPTANIYLVVSYAYDDKGNLAKQSLAEEAQNSAYAIPDWNGIRTEYSYDAKNRILTEEFIGDANHHYITSYEYDGWNVLITDPNGHQKKLYKDAYGQLAQTNEYLDGEIYSTKYEYNLLGKIVKIIDSQNNTRNFVYDSLGRLISQEEMHRADAQEFGVWSYVYDAASNLVQKTDPKEQVVRYAYDSLNRILSEDFQGQEGTEVVYTYDTGTYGKGRLYRVFSEGATTNYTYDKWGRVTKEAKTISGRVYNTQWTYNIQSAPLSIVYPDNSKVYYTYNKDVLPTALRTAEPNQNIVTSMPLITSVTYSPLKQIKEIRYNSGIVSTNTFDPVQGYRLTHKRTVNPFNLVIQDLDYSYDNVGNIIGLVDSSQTALAKITAYEYDDLDRLTSATVTNSANNADYQQTYAYDPIGNILEKSDIGRYLYENVNPYQANSIANQNYTYDVNGNLINDGAKEYIYNWADRLARVNISEGNVLLNLYDQSGARTVKQLTSTKPDPMGGEITYITKSTYPNSSYEEETAGNQGQEQNWITTKTRHIVLGNQTIAHFTVNPQGQVEKALVFSDHLGSASLLTDAFGRPKVLYDYYPFGGTRMEQQVGGGMRVAAYQYTGKEKDVETGLNYYGARFYAAGVGRFTQSDPVYLAVGNDKLLETKTKGTLQQYFSNPQNLNAYSYALNNPVRYTDPNGEYWETIFDLVSLGLSLYDFNRNPSIFNGAFVGLDAIGTATPFPAVFGYLKNGIRGYRIAKYFEKVADKIGDIVKIGELFVKNVTFNFTRKAWSTGEAGNDVASMVGHFFKHGDEVGAKTVGEYYNKANDFIDNKSFTHSWKEGSDTVYYNKDNNLISILNGDNQISSYYKVTDPKKLSDINKVINNSN